MTDTFISQLDQLGLWRLDVAQRLARLASWMGEHGLLDAALEERLQRLTGQVRSDKITVAFVAEFSRGKSELINALFFADYGRRIMPASAGRTTMCPTEIGYDPALAPCLRLLPIETRREPRPLMDWREAPESWTCMALDVLDPQQLADALQQVVQTVRVTLDDARAMGLWDAQSPDSPAPVDAQGLVEVPRWRHALINLPHPLLAQGLVVLDTPGLNAIGAEPELTVSLLPLAHATVFILGADTGLTRSDDAIWREHLPEHAASHDTRLVVLNKIDTLWDALSSPQQVQQQIERQRISVAEQLGMPQARVFAISAHKGLVAKVTCDHDLLQASRLPALEQALAAQVTQQRQSILRAAVSAGLDELQCEAGRVLTLRRRDLVEQLLELKSLRGKNSAIIRHMRARIAQEQAEFHCSEARIQALRSVHHRQLREVLGCLGACALRQEMQMLTQALQANGLKLGVKRIYGDTFARLRQHLQQAGQRAVELQTLLTTALDQLNAEQGFTLQVQAAPMLKVWCDELNLIERNHVQYLGLANVFRLARPEFTERLVRALYTRIRNTHQGLLSELELWSKSVTAQLDTQLRERQQNFTRRIEAIDRIQQAAEGLDQRIAEIQAQAQTCDQLELKLKTLTTEVQDAPSMLEPVPAALEVA